MQKKQENSDGGKLGKLFVVATPIGNMEDITLRAIRILREVDIIFAEDTRTTGMLLKRHEIVYKKIDSYNAKNSESKNAFVLKLLEEGKDVALVSDAGTPSISDPGYSLINFIRKNNMSVEIVPIPGASALTTFISALGVGTHAFTFYGFLPHKKGRQTILKEILASEKSSIFYESTHRLLKFLQEMQKLESERQIVIGKELTKIYEEFIFGTAEELINLFEKNPDKLKGEFVVMVV